MCIYNILGVKVDELAGDSFSCGYAIGGPSRNLQMDASKGPSFNLSNLGYSWNFSNCLYAASF